MDGQEISRTSDGNSRNSNDESEQNSGGNGKSREYNGGIESTRPNEMGSTYEQFENDSRGDSNKGDNLQLTESIENRFEMHKTEEEQKIAIENTNVKNLSYAVINGKIYFRENSVMIEKDIPVTTINRIKGLIELRDFPDENIKLAQEKLNKQYDNFVKKYGLINSRGNRLAFEEDSSYYLLCSLEVGCILRTLKMVS